MGNVLYTPGCWVSIVTGDAFSPPRWLSGILECATLNTLAPVTGQARIVVADPDGSIAATFKPNDLVTVYYSSRRNQAVTGSAQLAGTPSPSWTGLVDTCQEYSDPQTDYGRAALIVASTYWKLFTITPVPLTRYTSGQYPGSNLSVIDLLNQAIVDTAHNTGITVDFSLTPGAIVPVTPPWTVPNDFENPQLQSWASFLLSTVIVAGVECYFDESGKLILRAPQFTQSAIAATIPDEEVLSRQAGVSDQGLVTNVVVTYGIQPFTQGAQIAPNGDLSDYGVLPEVLQNLQRLGNRFLGLYVPWISAPADAGYYAATVRALGLAQADAAEPVSILNGDLRVGTIVATPGTGKRYYLATVQHQYSYGSVAETRPSLRFGIGLGKAWAAGLLSGVDAYGDGGPYLGAYLQLPGGGTTAPSVPSNLPALASDPSARLTNPTLNVQDIARILQAAGSPFADQATYIWTQCQVLQVDPAFALAVWRAETSLGTTGTGTITGDKNIGGVRGSPHQSGVDADGFSIYPDYQTAISDWIDLVGGPAYLGGNTRTVSAIGAKYAPNDQGQNPTWVPNVTKFMRQYRGQAQTPTASGAPGTPWSGAGPSGFPFAGTYAVTQQFGPTTFASEPPSPPGYSSTPHFHRGIDLACPCGTPLLATMGGTVVGGTDVLDAATGYGFLVAIQAGPWTIKLGHCQGLYPGVTNGQTVKAGQPIAISNNTGNSAGCHVHYEIDYQGINHPIDPVPFL